MDFYEYNGKVVVITPKIIEQIRNLKSHRANDSGYCPEGLMLQWRHEDNTILSLDEFKSLYMPMQFISMIGTLTKNFKEKYKVEYHHEALLRRLYIEYDDCNQPSPIITTGFKRPFGNKDVIGDVAEEMKATFSLEGKIEYYPYNVLEGTEAGDDDCEDYNNRIEDLIEKEYFKFIDILEYYFKEFQIAYRHFECVPKIYTSPDERFNWSELLQPEFGNHRLHNYMDNWKLSKSELRDEIIDVIVK